MLRLLVFGSRTFSDRELMFETLDELRSREPIGVVIEGEAPGADSLAREWAESRGIEVEKFPADWAQYGRAAGPIRNKQMLDEGNPDLAFCFIDKPLANTKGSKNMYKQACAADVMVRIFGRMSNATKSN